MEIKVKEINFDWEISERTGLDSYWVSGNLELNTEEYNIQGSIDAWENILHLNSLLEEEISEEDLMTNSNEGNNLFDTEDKQWIFNVTLEQTEYKTQLKLFHGEYFNPDSGDSVFNQSAKFSKLINSKESIIKAIIIEIFIKFLDGEEQCYEYSIE